MFMILNPISYEQWHAKANGNVLFSGEAKARPAEAAAHSETKLQNSAKNQTKLNDQFHSFNILANFENEGEAITRKENDMNLLKLILKKFVKSLQVNIFLAFFQQVGITVQKANGDINVKTSSGSAGSQQSKGSGGASGLQHQQAPPASSGSSTSKSVVDTSSSSASSASHNGAF